MEKPKNLESTPVPKLVYKEEREAEGFVAKGHYLDGKKEGTWTWYYKSGRPSMKQTYKNGLLHGPMETYDYPNGEILSKGHYINGKREGVKDYWKTQNEGGYYWMRHNYKDDKFHGLWECYNRKGILTELSGFKEGIAIKRASQKELDEHNEKIKEIGIDSWRDSTQQLFLEHP
jgi:antitoxin component YwqK of YwqJK toxin-antitoxin module